jgi:hypothetical protein
MDGTKESDLVTAVLMYAIRCLAEGDQVALRNMNFGPREIEALREMNLADLYRIESLRAHCLDIGLNRDVYWPMVEHLRRQRESEELQQLLIVADAPLEMMQTLFGLGSREYTRLRRLLTVDPSVGRPAEPDEASSNRLWGVWVQRVGDQREGPLSPHEYLAIHRETGISMRGIWNLTQRWNQYGDLSGQRNTRASERACSDG